MKKRNLLFFSAWILTLGFVFLLVGVSSYGVQDEDKSAYHTEKIETGYWVIEANTVFNTKAMYVAFNHPNTGTKKIEPDNQVLGMQFALYNPGEEDIKIRRNDFHVNAADINHFIVQEKTTQPLVVIVPAGQAIGITNYYIVDAGVQDIQGLKVVYTSVDKNYKKLEIGIPLIQEK